MHDVDYVVPQAEDLLRLPGGPQLSLKQGLLALYLTNPFLDEDAAALALRMGVDGAEVTAALEILCRQGLLRELGRRGYSLAPVGPECLVAAGGADADADSAPTLAGATSSQDVAGTGGAPVEIPPSTTDQTCCHLPQAVAEPMRVIQEFMETLEPGSLAAARAALEQVKILLAQQFDQGSGH